MNKKIIISAFLLLFSLLQACGSNPVKADDNGSVSNTKGRSTVIDYMGKPYTIDINKVSNIQISPVDAETGKQKKFSLTIPSRVDINAIAPTDRIKVNAVWSVNPADKGIYLKSRTGEFVVMTNARHNSIYTVTAKVQGRDQPVVGTLLVYSKLANPLIGMWFDKDKIINELIFSPDGKFFVTRNPIDTRRDYWGTYSVNTETRQLKMKITNGNKIPEDANVGNASYSFNAEGHLVLRNLYFGTIHSEDKRRQSYVFTPR